MHRATFDEVKKGRDFTDRSWNELPDDRDLAIEAEAWYLHDLAGTTARQPGTPLGYTRNELLALGYNTGPGNMLAFAHGATPGSQGPGVPGQAGARTGPRRDRQSVRAEQEPREAMGPSGPPQRSSVFIARRRSYRALAARSPTA
ncbi:hypothetical protein ACRAWF_31270 [Streptomyces sp. L7]